ncbi:MAG: indole-3-glycerol phosphate synthase TrpC [Thermoguttaceae bacterium]
MANDILSQIVASRVRDIESSAAYAVSVSELKSRWRDRNARDDFRSFDGALRERAAESGVAAIIAEIKRGSPARGLFAPMLDPVAAARSYELGGAACLSVLTEPHFFFGALDDLVAARSACTLPVLQKDFIVTEYQVYEAALHTDAILLIARCLDYSQLSDLHSLATELRLDVLVEVFDEADIQKIAPLRFPLIGINNRNLATMGIDTQNTARWASQFHAEQLVVAASGMRSRGDIEQLITAGVRTFLVGETLSVSSNPVVTLREMVYGT